MASYTNGTSDPVIKADPGAGTWNSSPKTLKMWALKRAIIHILPHAYVIIGDDATKHMAHYLGNGGANYTIDLADMVNDVRSAKLLYDAELAMAKQYVMTLPVGVANITSARATGGYNTKSENWNWFFAVGGYSAWGKGVATVARDSKGKQGYRMAFEYKFYDRYNWDKGKSVEIFGIKITDKFMAEFHRQGLAKEFDMFGSMKETVEWGTLSALPAPPAGGSRSGR